MSKKVLLYSGGLDSFVMKELYAFDEIVFLKLGTEENVAEYNLIKKDITKEVDLNLKEYELKNKIIPYRNNIMCLIASNYGNEIYMAFTAGDTTKDKDYVFKSQMENILNYFAQDTEKVKHPHYPYKIKMPFKNKTKSEIVRMYLDEKKDIKKLIETKSCYNGNDCGVCRSCLSI